MITLGLALIFFVSTVVTGTLFFSELQQGQLNIQYGIFLGLSFLSLAVSIVRFANKTRESEKQ